MVDRAGPRRRYRGAGGRPRHSVRDEPVWRLLQRALDEQLRITGRDSLDVLDAGGGTGSFAVPIAALGHRVTVIDPSADSLAAFARRAAEESVTDRVRGVQAEAIELPTVVPAESFDVIVCHNVLEVVDDPTAALAAMRHTARRGGRLSIMVANRNAVVLAKVVAGHLEEAGRALADPHGRWGPDDPLPRRFALDELRRLVLDAGLMIEASHGLHAFRDLVPNRLYEFDADEIVTELEIAAEEHPAFQAIAGHLHVLARSG